VAAITAAVAAPACRVFVFSATSGITFRPMSVSCENAASARLAR
jgi:hypothetical protein